MLSLSHAVTAFSARAAARNFAKQLHLRVLLKIDEFNETGQPRYEDQPRIVGVIRQEHTGERQIADWNRLLRELRMRRPVLRSH